MTHRHHWLVALSATLPLAIATGAMAEVDRPPSPGSALYGTTPARPAVGRPGASRPNENRANENGPAESRPTERRPAEGSRVSRSVHGGGARVVAPPALNGRWQDRECVPLLGAISVPPLYIVRHYEFDDQRKRWNLSADVFNNDRCRIDTKLLTYRGRGTFRVTGLSKVGSNVYEASFVMQSWQATPSSREGTLALFNGRCGSGFFDEGRLLDLARTGCSLIGLRPLAQVSTGNELVRVADGKVFLGARPFVRGHGNERPTQLSSYGLTRL